MRTTSGGSSSTLTIGEKVLHPAEQFPHPPQSDFRESIWRRIVKNWIQVSGAGW
jgi:hypothetical protein